jgi:Fe-S oxidoreductase
MTDNPSVDQQREPEQSAAVASPKVNLFRMIDISQSLQIPEHEARWFTGRPPEGVQADVVFYLGCNILRTPNIALGVIDVLDALGVKFHTIGGGGNCCGILQFREENLDAADAVASNTFRNFAAFSPKEVVTWCPTCELQFTDFGADYLPREFEIKHVTRFLAEHLDVLKSKIVQPVPVRVALDEHAPLGDDDNVVEDAKLVLRAVPGVEVVDVPQHRLGYQCSAVRNQAASQAALTTLFESAARAGVDYLLSIYHSCHRELVLAERDYPFQVLNFTAILGRALGKEREDTYKHYKLMDDTEQILQQVLASGRETGYSLEEIRRAIQWEFGKKGN